MTTIAVSILFILYSLNLDARLPGLVSNLENTAKPAPPKVGLVRVPSHRPAPEPIKTGSETFTPQAKSVYAVDFTTSQVLINHNASQKLPIASITKLVTVMTILQTHKLDEVVTIPTLPAYAPEEAKLGITPGQKFTLSELLKAALIPSANDAADALAIWDSGSIEKFTLKMNTLAKTWEIPDTHFSSASGLVDTNNYATAESLVKFAKIALTNKKVEQFVSLAGTSVTDLAGQKYDVANTNQLLNNTRFNGIKTGYTPTAGQCFMGLVKIPGARIITVVLNSPDRFAETQSLADYLERNYQWQTP